MAQEHLSTKLPTTIWVTRKIKKFEQKNKGISIQIIIELQREKRTMAQEHLSSKLPENIHKKYLQYGSKTEGYIACEAKMSRAQNMYTMFESSP